MNPSREGTPAAITRAGSGLQGWQAGAVQVSLGLRGSNGHGSGRYACINTQFLFLVPAGTAHAQAINFANKLLQNKNVHVDIAIRPQSGSSLYFFSLDQLFLVAYGSTRPLPS